MKVTVFSTKPFEIPFLKQFNQNGYILNFVREALTVQTAALASGSQAVALLTSDDASAPVLEELHRVGVWGVALRSAGYDHIDLKKAVALGMRVAHVPCYSPIAIAEHAVALMMCLNRRLLQAHDRVHRNDFHLDGLVGFNMADKTVGIIGTGKIGSAVARILHGFGCRLLGYDLVQDRSLTETLALQYTDLSTLISQADIITLHCPLTVHTRHLLAKEQIDRMKRGAMIINTARGAVLNTADAIAGLKSGQIGFLGLDVYEHEKALFFADHSEDILQDDLFARLLTFPNVLITGHQAFLTDTALANIAKTTMQTLTCWGKSLPSENELHLEATLD